jgi:O-antigen/teichoic acid export membrane protein
MEMFEKQQESPSQGLGKIIFKNTAFVTMGNFALKVVHFLFNVYVIRELGDGRFGQYSTVLAFTGLFSIFAELGMTQYAMREIARDRTKAKFYLWNLIAIRSILAVVGVIGITVAGRAVGYSDELVLGIFLHTTGYLLSAVAIPLEAVLNGNERLDYVTANRVIAQLVIVILGSIFLFNGFGYIWLLIANLVSILPTIAIGIWALKRHRLIDFSIQINPRAWLTIIKAGIPFGIISLALTIAFSIDTVMLSMWVSDSEVGWYNVAYNLVRSMMLFFTGFSVAIVPSLSRTYVQDTNSVYNWYQRSVKFIMLISLPIAFGGLVVADQLIDFLYTPEYIPSALGLKILVWDVPLLMFTSFNGNMTTVIGAERSAARIYTINAIANVILNAYAIPRYGFIGAAVVTVVTDLIGAIQFHMLMRQRLALPDMKSVLLRVLAASGIMAGVIFMVGNLHVIGLVLLGGVLYAGLVLLFKLLDSSEMDLIFRLVRKVGRSLQARGAS